MPFPRLLAALLAVLVLVGPPAGAQQPAAPAAGAGEANNPIEIIRDVARGGRSADQPAGEAPAEPSGTKPAPPLAHPQSVPEQASSPIGDRVLASAQRLVVGLVGSAREDVQAVQAILRRLQGLSSVDPARLEGPLGKLGIPAAVSLAVAALGRFALRPVFRRIGRAATGRGPLQLAGLGLVCMVLNLAWVMVATVVGIAAMRLSGSATVTDPIIVHYFAAFMLAGALIAFLRAIFSPWVPELRSLPMSDRTARYWTVRLSAVVVLIAFAEILVPTLVFEIATPISARATVVAIYLVALLYLIWLVVVNRQAPREHFERLSAAREDDLWLAVVAAAAHYWHFAALAGLLFLLHQVMTAGTAAVPVLIAVAEIAGALALARLGGRLLDRLAGRGVHLSDRINRAMPGMEARLDAFARPFVRTMRYLLAALWIGFVLQALGVLQLSGWIERRFHIDIVGVTTSLVVIVVVGFAAWLVLSTWIEYRLTPRAGHIATARERTLLALLRNAAAVIILLVGLYYALLEIGISLAPLLASAGVIALAISWGSQKLVQDIITGLFIQLENAINVGDVIEAAGKIGVVEKLTIRSVSLRDVQGVYHLIPFSAVDAVSNHMKGFSYHVADFSIALGADIDAAKAAMLAAYDELDGQMEWNTKLLGGIEWFGVEALSNSSITLRARLKTAPGEQWAVGRAYAEAVKRRFDAEGIEIPFPQMKLWFGGPGAAVSAPASLVPTRQTRAANAPTDADADGILEDGDAR